jgi:hypothetical protein
MVERILATTKELKENKLITLEDEDESSLFSHRE